MRVLLLNPPFREGIIRDNFCCHTAKAHYIWAPSDLLYLSGILNRPPFEVAVRDSVVEHDDWTSLLAWCEIRRPEVIISLTSSASYGSDLQGLQRLKRQLGSQVFVIGNLPSFEPARILADHDWLDGVLHNFLDVRIAGFLLDQTAPPRSVSYRKPNGECHIGDVNAFDRADGPLDVPAPQHHLFPNAAYSTPLALQHPQTTVLTATGCPYACTFCIYGPMKLYRRTLASLEQEFDSCVANGIRELYVVDPTFNADLRFMREVCQLMIRKRYGLSWACRIHPERVSLEDFHLLKAAGCHTIQIGAESGNAGTLKEIAPTKELDQIRHCFQLAKQAGLRTLGYFIIGHPNEDRDQTMRTIDFAIELDPFFASFSNYMPLNGTKSHETALKCEHIDDDLQTFDLNGSPVEFKGAALDAGSRADLMRLAYRKFYLRPRQIMKYVRDFKNLPLYVRNGMHVVWNQVVLDRANGQARATTRSA